jgi:hypothetical protein
MHSEEVRRQNMFQQGCDMVRLPTPSWLSLKKVAVVRFRFTHCHALNTIPGEFSANCVGPEIFNGEVHGIHAKGNAVARYKPNWALPIHKPDDEDRLTA